MSKKEFSFRTEISLKEAAARIEEIAATLREGTVCLRKGGESVVLEPGYRVALEIEAGAKKEKARLSINLSWLLEEVGQEGREELWIGSQPPQEEEKEEETENEEDEAEEKPKKKD